MYNYRNDPDSPKCTTIPNSDPVNQPYPRRTARTIQSGDTLSDYPRWELKIP